MSSTKPFNSVVTNPPTGKYLPVGRMLSARGFCVFDTALKRSIRYSMCQDHNVMSSRNSKSFVVTTVMRWTISIPLSRSLALSLSLSLCLFLLLCLSFPFPLSSLHFLKISYNWNNSVVCCILCAMESLLIYLESRFTNYWFQEFIMVQRLDWHAFEMTLIFLISK